MKNYWLIAGGISVGLGLAFLAENHRVERVKKGELKDEDRMTNGDSALSIIGGTFLILVGIYGFDK